MDIISKRNAKSYGRQLHYFRQRHFPGIKFEIRRTASFGLGLDLWANTLGVGIEIRFAIWLVEIQLP